MIGGLSYQFLLFGTHCLELLSAASFAELGLDLFQGLYLGDLLHWFG